MIALSNDLSLRKESEEYIVYPSMKISGRPTRRLTVKDLSAIARKINDFLRTKSYDCSGEEFSITYGTRSPLEIFFRWDVEIRAAEGGYSYMGIWEPSVEFVSDKVTITAVQTIDGFEIVGAMEKIQEVLN